jgi:gas vesicle protein
MGNQSTKFGFITDKTTRDNLDEEIGRKNLKTNYFTWFNIITWFLISLAIISIGMCIWLTVEIYNNGNRTETERYVSITITTIFTFFAIMLIVYYKIFIGKDLYHADIVSTDMARLGTQSVSNTSLKANITNMIANKIGTNDDKVKTDIYNRLNDTMNFSSSFSRDNRSRYLEAQDGRIQTRVRQRQQDDQDRQDRQRQQDDLDRQRQQDTDMFSPV